MVVNIHGDTRHTGKHPVRAAGSTEWQTELIRLRREMKEAVDQTSTSGPPNCATAFGSLKKGPNAARVTKRAPSHESKTLDSSLERLAQQCGEWLRGSGPESDIVISSRIRLARNLAEFPFIRKCTDHDRASIERVVREKVLKAEDLNSLLYLDVDDLETVVRQFLVERQLISREHAESDGARSVAIDAQEKFSLMINEEESLADPADEERTGPGRCLGTDQPYRRFDRIPVDVCISRRSSATSRPVPPTSVRACASA